MFSRDEAALITRLGGPGDVASALSIYEQSNLARRRGTWPSRQARLDEVRANLQRDDAWFLLASDRGKDVGMALILPFREQAGAGPLVAGTAFLDLIYVRPERWGEGIGGRILDRLLDEAARRGTQRIVLWTHERDNDRAHRLYRGRGFVPTGLTGQDPAGQPTHEWTLSFE